MTNYLCFFPWAYYEIVKVEFVELYVPVLPEAFCSVTAGYELTVLAGSKMNESPTIGGVVKLTVNVLFVNDAKFNLLEGLEDKA